MTGDRSLAGAAHDIAHHTVSGLSYLYPHLACRVPEGLSLPCRLRHS
jgi:hypothetical protein